MDIHPGLATVEEQDAHHDLVVDEVAETFGDVFVNGEELLEQDRLVEVKSALVVYSKNQRRGRFTFRESQHPVLVEANAVYVLVVCEPRPERKVIAATALEADVVDEHIDGSWIDPGDGGPRYRKFAWTRFIDVDEVMSRG